MKKAIEIMDGEPHPIVTKTDAPMVTITLPDSSEPKFDYTMQEVDVKGLLDFAIFVADEIFDEYFEDNAGAFSEIACRKLYKLGIVKRDKEIWIYEHSKVAQD